MRIEDIFNISELKKLFRNFYITTGLDVACFDTEGAEMFAYRAGFSVCSAAGNCEKCRKYIVYGGGKSRELGEPYIFSCGCGLIMCSFPVIFGTELLGSVVCGPVMLWEADDYAFNEIKTKTADMPLKISKEDFLGGIKELSCVNLTSAAQILYIIINSLAREHSAFLEQRAEITRQQSEIAELIARKKTAEAYIDGIEKKAALYKYPAELEKELISYVQLGKKQEARNILNNFLSEIFSFASGNLETVKAKLYELMAFLSRAAVDAGAPLKEVYAITRESARIMDEESDFETVCYLVTGALDKFIGVVYVNRLNKPASTHLTKAIEYIRKNYREDLTLTKVAGEIFVSGYYLSHLFRDEMDTTFSDYVIRVRIDRAKALMKEGGYKVQEISELSGFNDPNYFAKVFKKNTGTAPKDYMSIFSNGSGR